MYVKTSVNIEITELAKVIRYLSNDEIELLTAKLNGEEKELKKRFNDIKQKKVKLLSKEEVFKK